MMRILEKSRVQELENREDLRLLMDGDLVSVNLHDYDGVAVYRGIDKLFMNSDWLIFETIGSEMPYKYLCEDIKKLDVQKNKIVRRRIIW